MVPRAAPLLIWDDPQHLPWSDEEKTALAADADTRWLLQQFPASVHARPEGGAGSQHKWAFFAFREGEIEVVDEPLQRFEHVLGRT